MCISPLISEKSASASATTTSPGLKNGDDRGKSVSASINHVDFEQPRREYLFTMPSFLRTWVVETLLRRNDARNLPIFLVGMNILTTSIPYAMLLFYLEKNQVVTPSTLIPMGILYAVAHLKTWARSFMLALHYITHCSIFKRELRFLDHIMKSFLCNFFGIPPGLYYPHHVGMHHSQDNVAPFDMSSTQDYYRGSKWNHFKYMARFVFFGMFELPFRLFQMSKYALAIQASLGSTIFWSMNYILFQRYPMSTFFVFLFPWAACSFGLMQGNFKEHIFVDPDDHENNYKSAFTCINAPSNALTFNTGYHIEHHEEPGLPWYQLPELFLKNMHKHAANDSLVFNGIGSMEVGTLVLNGKFDELADHYLNVGQPKRTKQELIAEFKRRLVPIFPSLVDATPLKK